MTDILSIVIGILGIIFGIGVSSYYYKKGQRIKEPCWDIISNNVIQNGNRKISDVKVLYKRREVSNITISRIIFWNKGKETIYSEDINTINHLRIGTKSGNTILSLSILSNNNPSSVIRCINSPDMKYTNIVFDYIDQHQGAVFQIIHDGLGINDLEITGDIKGVKTVRRVKAAKRYSLIKNQYFILLFPAIILFTISISTIITEGLHEFTYFLNLVIGIIVFIYSGLGILKDKGITIPKGLEIFNN